MLIDSSLIRHHNQSCKLKCILKAISVPFDFPHRNYGLSIILPHILCTNTKQANFCMVLDIDESWRGSNLNKSVAYADVCLASYSQ